MKTHGMFGDLGRKVRALWLAFLIASSFDFSPSPRSHRLGKLDGDGEPTVVHFFRLIKHLHYAVRVEGLLQDLAGPERLT